MHNRTSYGNTFSIPLKERFRLMYYEKVELSDKKETNLPETFEEWGEMPVCRVT